MKQKNLFLIFLLAFLPLVAYADAVEIDGIYYNLNADNHTAEVTSNPNGYSDDVVIPSTVNGCSVTSISNEAFSSCYSLTSVVIPVGVTSIGQGAFENCPNLSSAPIPAGLTSIGMWAFLNTGLTSLSIPASVTSIGADAFGSCPALASIQVEAGNTIYDSRDNCNAIIEKSSNTLIAGCKNSVIPSTVTSIGDWAFYYSGLASVTIPSSVTSIGEWAFGGTALTSLTIPASVTSIGNDAFSYCSGLESIQVEAGNTKYDSRDNCNAIIEKSSNRIIRGCKNTSFPADVTTIGYRAFMDSGITSIVIPSTITNIETMAFEGCEKLESIQVASDNEKYDSHNNCNAIIETNSNTLIVGCKNTVIPEGVTIIGERAFSGDALTVLSIPSSVTSIGSLAFSGNVEMTDVFCYAAGVPDTDVSAFYDCNISNVSLHVPEGSIAAYTAAGPWSGFKEIVALPDQEYTDQGVIYTFNAKGSYTVSGHTNACTGDITIPETVNGYRVTAIGDEAFTDCVSLTSVVIPEGVTSIGGWAFCNTGISSLNIPASVASIGECAFGSCPALGSIQVEAGNTTYDSRNGCNAIIRKDNNTLIAGCKTTVIPSEVTSIAEYAFYFCNLSEVTIPSGVTSIGGHAFRGTALTSLTIPASVTSIDNDAFSDCRSLESIQVASGNTKYDSRDNCNAIIEKSSNTIIRGCKNTSFPSSVTTIGYRAFMNSGITSIVIPSTITNIETMAFEGCEKLESIQVVSDNEKYDSRNNSNAIIETSSNTLIAGCKNTVIPEGVTSIDERAFAGDYLTVLSIPSSVTSIGSLAFSGNVELTDIFCYAADVPEAYGDAFEACFKANVLHVPAGSIEAYRAKAPWNGFNEILALPTQQDTDNQGVIYTLNDDGQTYTVSGHTDACTGNITIPSTVNGCSVTAIGYQAFDGCRNMTSVTIPNSVASIGQWAFWNCSSLTSITIPKSVTSIGDYLFHSCSNLTTIIVETGNPVYDSRDNCNAIIETTTNMLLAGCKSTVIPNSVTSFSYGAFYGIDGFTSLSISKNVISIKGEAFASSGLTSIIVDEDNTVYDSRNNCNAIIETATNTLIAGCKNTSIPNNVKAIGNMAFYRSHDLTSVTIPSGVTSIGNWAFGECGSLTSLAIPNGVTSIGSYAFCYCGGITSLSLPNSLTSLGDRAFAGCGGLTDVYCFAVNVPATDANAFLDSNIGNATLYVPEGCKATYEAADYWKDFKNIVELVLPKAESGLIYSGTAQNLISASSITTMQYSLDGTTYSTTIPQGTDAKEYTIYYKEDNLGIANSIKVTIAPKTVSSPTISLSETTCSYDGKAQEPTVTVKDGPSTIPSTEYTVSYTNNTEIGTATVTITDKEGGNYIVSGSTTFIICRAIKDLFKGSDLWAGYVAQEDLAVPTGLTAYVITSLGNLTATASQITYIPQGVPVLLKRDNTDVNNFVAFPETGTSPTTNLLKAYTTDKTVANREGYVLFKDEFVLVSAGTLPAGKVFLPANSSSKSSTRSIIIDGGDTTDIDGIKVDLGQSDEKWYDLQGRRLDKKPTKKGLYILNGHKVIVK